MFNLSFDHNLGCQQPRHRRSVQTIEHPLSPDDVQERRGLNQKKRAAYASHSQEARAFYCHELDVADKLLASAGGQFQKQANM